MFFASVHNFQNVVSFCNVLRNAVCVASNHNRHIQDRDGKMCGFFLSIKNEVQGNSALDLVQAALFYSIFHLDVYLFRFCWFYFRNGSMRKHNWFVSQIQLCECEDREKLLGEIFKSNQTAHKLNKTSWKPFCVGSLLGIWPRIFFFSLAYAATMYT